MNKRTTKVREQQEVMKKKEKRTAKTKAKQQTK